MDLSRILSLAKISKLSYVDPVSIGNEFTDMGYHTIKFFEHKNSQGYFLENDNEIVLVFRGTDIENDKSDVVSDLMLKKEKSSMGGKVHSGFNKELNKIWKDIVLTIGTSIKPIYITGHSLGAGMGLIAASRLKNKVELVVTFGAPRVGDNNFVLGLDCVHYRVRNNRDIITKLPPELLGFKHHGKCIYLDYFGNISEPTKWRMIKDNFLSHLRAISKKQWFKGVYDHDMEQYIKKLTKLVKE